MAAAPTKFPQRERPPTINPDTGEILPSTSPLAPAVTTTAPAAEKEERSPNPGIAAIADVKKYISTSVSVAAHRRKEAFEEKKRQLEKDRLKQTAGTGHVFRGGTPTAARMPSPSPYNDMPSDVTSPRSDYSGRARMVVLPMGNDPSSVGPQASFDDFFITSIQGADSEKTDVIETFGAPHLFASGRFMRKYQISGQCRTNPLNINSESRPEYRTSQYALFQRFYDLYLRATMQAQRSTYTRLIVDDEFLDGWIVSLSPSRASDSEQFAHFTFTMLVRNRGSVYDEAADKVLAPFAAVKGKPKDAKTKAKLELADVKSKGKLVLTGSPFSITLSPDMPTFDITGLKLLAETPKDGMASVELKLDGGAGLELESGSSRMTLRAGAAEDLKLTVQVKDFRALQAAADAATRVADPDDSATDYSNEHASTPSDARADSIKITLVATSENTVPFDLNITLRRLDATKLATLSATLMGKTVDWAASTSTSKPLRLRIAAPITNPSLELKLSAQFMTGNGATLAAALVTATKLAGPTLQSRCAVNLPKEGGAAADGPAEDQEIARQVAVTTNSTEAVVEGTAAVWTLQLNLGDAAKALVTSPSISPFKLSSAYLLRLPTSFTLPGPTPTKVDGPIVEVVVDVPPGKTRNWLTSVGRPAFKAEQMSHTRWVSVLSTTLWKWPVTDRVSTLTIDFMFGLSPEGQAVLNESNLQEYLKGASWQIVGHFTQEGTFSNTRKALTAQGSVGSTSGGSLVVDGVNIPLLQVRVYRQGNDVHVTFIAIADSTQGKDTLYDAGLTAYSDDANGPVADTASFTPADPAILAPPTPYALAR